MQQSCNIGTSTTLGQLRTQPRVRFCATGHRDVVAATRWTGTNQEGINILHRQRVTRTSSLPSPLTCPVAATTASAQLRILGNNNKSSPSLCVEHIMWTTLCCVCMQHIVFSRCERWKQLMTHCFNRIETLMARWCRLPHLLP
jgi:hypothetical protein